MTSQMTCSEMVDRAKESPETTVVTFSITPEEAKILSMIEGSREAVSFDGLMPSVKDALFELEFVETVPATRSGSPMRYRWAKKAEFLLRFTRAMDDRTGENWIDIEEPDARDRGFSMGYIDDLGWITS